MPMHLSNKAGQECSSLYSGQQMMVGTELQPYTKLGFGALSSQDFVDHSEALAFSMTLTQDQRYSIKSCACWFSVEHLLQHPMIYLSPDLADAAVPLMCRTSAM